MSLNLEVVTFSEFGRPEAIAAFFRVAYSRALETELQGAERRPSGHGDSLTHLTGGLLERKV
jgi:hypothetical protein